MFFHEPKFKFFSSIPGVKETYPIIKSSSYKRKWVENAASSYKEKIKDLENYQNTITGIVKCPGIFDLMNIGWILPAWCDFIIETTNDNISWRVPAMLDGITCGEDFNKSPISFISTDQPTMSVPMSDENHFCLVKVNTPWVVDIPKNWKLLILPVSYSDELRFESTQGIIRPSEHMEINPQLLWKVKNGTELVKAGTPLCQLIPIKDDNINYECYDFGEEQRIKQKRTYFKRASTFLRKI